MYVCLHYTWHQSPIILAGYCRFWNTIKKNYDAQGCKGIYFQSFIRPSIDNIALGWCLSGSSVWQESRELVIWIVFTLVTPFPWAKWNVSSLWSEYHDDFRQFLHIYSQDVACYGEKPQKWPKSVYWEYVFRLSQSLGEFHQFWFKRGQYGQLLRPRFHHGQILYARRQGADAAGDSGWSISSSRVWGFPLAECLKNKPIRAARGGVFLFFL